MKNLDHVHHAKLTRRELLRAAAGSLVVSRSAFAAPPKVYWPRGSDWEARTPKDAGMDGAGIEDAMNYAGEHNSTGLVILRGGRIVTEKYWKDWTPETSQPIFSSSKSVTATLIGMAIEEGKLKGVQQAWPAFVLHVERHAERRHHVASRDGHDFGHQSRGGQGFP